MDGPGKKVRHSDYHSISPLTYPHRHTHHTQGTTTGTPLGCAAAAKLWQGAWVGARRLASCLEGAP